MYYTRPAHMTQTVLNGANRQPALPASEAEADCDTGSTLAGEQQQPHALPSPAAATAAAGSCIIAEEQPDDSNRVGVIADSVPASLSAVVALRPSLSKRSLGLSSRHVSAPGPFGTDADEAQRLAQRALRTLQSQKVSMKDRGSWPGGEFEALAIRAGAFMIQRSEFLCFSILGVSVF